MTTIDPKNLRVHPIIKGQPEWSDEDPQFIALCRDIACRGVIDPVRVTTDNEIVDGRHRWRACKRLKREVPVEILTGDDLASFALRTLILRRHYTGGQRAYVAYPLLIPAFAEAKRRMLAGGKTQPNPFSEPSELSAAPSEMGSATAKTLEEWAEELSVSVRLLRQARELHELFRDDKKRTITDRDGVEEHEVTFKEFFEPRLLRDADPYGLGDVLKAVKQLIDQDNKVAAGKPPTGGRPTTVEKQIELFTEVFEQATKRFEYWQKFDDTAKKEHFEAVASTAEEMDPETLKAQADYYTRLAKTLRTAAKKAQRSKK